MPNLAASYKGQGLSVDQVVFEDPYVYAGNGINGGFTVFRLVPAIFYVTPGGNCGALAPCYGTIQAALNAAEDGTLIKVKQGTYREVPFKTSAGMVTMSGGWNETFTSQTGTTEMYAPLATGGGTVKVQPSVKIIPKP